MRTTLGAARLAIGVGLQASLVALAATPAIPARNTWPDPETLVTQLLYGPGVRNHPLYVIPSGAIRVPEGWPLDANGSITCITCHSELPSLQGGTERHLRRIEDGRVAEAGFCASCHVEGRHSAAGAHWMVVRLAHPKGETNLRTRGESSLDGDSKQCLECHDGVNAVESSELAPGSHRGSIGGNQQSHPVGVPYLGMGQRKGDVRLRPPNLLPKAIRLPDGKVSCISCHDLYAKGRGRLVVPIEESELCFTCHELN